MRAAGLAVALAFLSLTASVAASDAVSNAAMLETAVIMRVESKVTIEPGGALGGLKIETPLDPALQAALERVIRGWRFRPVIIDGGPRRAHTSMRVVLAVVGEGKSRRVIVDSVDFPMESNPDAITPDGLLAPITPGTLTPPRYPPEEERYGAMGRILLGILVTPDGRAGEVTAMQSMIFRTREANNNSIRRSIRAFEAAAIESAKAWTFKVPVAGTPRASADMTVCVPVQFSMVEYKELDAPGRWLTVVRLPKKQLAWLPPTLDALNLGVASATGSGISPLRSAFGLSSDVAGTTLQ